MKIVIANWKMNVGVRESVALARGSLLTLRGRKTIPELVICPSFVALSEVRKILAHSSASLGAQNIFWEASGSFTGETSSRMLQEVGATHVIIGHSERRQILRETDEMINKKVLQAIAEHFVPILCVGETKLEREEGRMQEVVQYQLTQALRDVRLHSADKVFVAYEPIWAIGTGETALVAQVVEAHQFIRQLVQNIAPQIHPDQFAVVYGGSVNPENAYELLRETEVDGVLVGGASLKINQFNEIVQAAVQVLESQQS